MTGIDVVVTGLGLVTPLGLDAPSTWAAILAGQSGIGRITSFDTSQFPEAVAGEVKGFRPPSVIPAKDVRHMDRYAQFALSASLEAVADAGLSNQIPFGERTGVYFGSGAGGYGLAEQNHNILLTRGPRRVDPQFLTNILPDAASGYIAIYTGATGPNMGPVAACATGAVALGEAAEVIKRGDADVMIAGGAEAPLVFLLYSGFVILRATATVGADPSQACKPFDARRDGFVVGEGAGAVVLESREHAEKRSAKIYAKLTGYGSSNDAFDMVASHEEGRGPTIAMRMALRKARIDPTKIGYINAHGTGTPLNDRVETRALHEVFGEHVYELAASSTKSMTAHLMGAAGAVEAIFSVLAMRDQILPPTMHYEVPDPDCDLDYVPNQARPVKGLKAVMSTSIGLGGHNAALIFEVD